MEPLRVHCILVNEGEDSDKITNFLYYALGLYLETDIFRYDCVERERPLSKEDLYTSWFVEIVLNRNNREAVLIKHHEADGGVEFARFIHHRIHIFNARYKYFASIFDLRTDHNFCDEMRYALMIRYILPSIWNDFHNLNFGNLESYRYLDYDHVPDNPGMQFDED